MKLREDILCGNMAVSVVSRLVVTVVVVLTPIYLFFVCVTLESLRPQ